MHATEYECTEKLKSFTNSKWKTIGQARGYREYIVQNPRPGFSLEITFCRGGSIFISKSKIYVTGSATTALAS